jgi:hypothetical protein
MIMKMRIARSHLQRALANRLVIALPAGRKRKAKGAQTKESSATPLP